MALTLVTPIVSALGVGVFVNQNHDWIHLGFVVATVQPGRSHVAHLHNGQGELVTIENPCIGNLTLSVVVDLDEPIVLNAEGSKVPFRYAIHKERFAVKYSHLIPLMVVESESDPDFIGRHSVVAQEELSC